MQPRCEPLVLPDSVAQYHERVVDELAFAHDHAVNVLNLDVLHVSLSGSHAYGSAHDGSDVDVTVVYLPDDATLLGLCKPKPVKHLSPSKDGHDIRFIGLPKLLTQMHKGSYPFVEVLWSPTWFATPVMAQLTAERKVFLTSGFARSCIGHASSVVSDIEDGVEVSSKQVAHAMRVLLLVADVIDYGDLRLDSHGGLIREMATETLQADRDMMVETFHAVCEERDERDERDDDGHLHDRDPDHEWMATTGVGMVRERMQART